MTVDKKKTIHFLNWNEKNAGTRLLDDQTNKTQLVITFVVRLMVVTMDWTNSRFRSIIQIDREINWIMYLYYGGAMRVYATIFLIRLLNTHEKKNRLQLRSTVFSHIHMSMCNDRASVLKRVQQQQQNRSTTQLKQ